MLTFNLSEMHLFSDELSSLAPLAHSNCYFRYKCYCFSETIFGEHLSILVSKKKGIGILLGTST